MSHPLFTLPLDNGGELGLMPCPGIQGVALVDSLIELKAWGAEAVLTLMPGHELAAKGVSELGDRVKELGMTWYHLPIEDDQVPDPALFAAWQPAFWQLVALLQRGGKLALHCKGGSGRTGLLAIRLLLALGWSLDKATAAVQALRPKALHTPLHQHWIADQAALLAAHQENIPMSTITIYHNPACGTSRNTLEMIRNSGEEPRVILYLQTPPSRDELVKLIADMGIPVRDLLRKNVDPYAELGLDDAKWQDEQLIDAMLAHPILINRPIVVTPLGTRLCRPSELVLDILPNQQQAAFTKEDGEQVVNAQGERVAKS